MDYIYLCCCRDTESRNNPRSSSDNTPFCLCATPTDPYGAVFLYLAIRHVVRLVPAFRCADCKPIRFVGSKAGGDQLAQLLVGRICERVIYVKLNAKAIDPVSHIASRNRGGIRSSKVSPASCLGYGMLNNPCSRTTNRRSS